MMENVADRENRNRQRYRSELAYQNKQAGEDKRMKQQTTLIIQKIKENQNAEASNRKLYESVMQQKKQDNTRRREMLQNIKDSIQ